MDIKTERHGGFAMKWLFWIIFTLALGVLASLLIPSPMVGTIVLDDSIYSISAQEMITQLRYARDNPQIRAVVLKMNTPGGTVSDTESVYREIMELRQTRPVVVVVEGMAASGGYYLASAADYVIAKASSEVGNIGVITVLPDSPMVMEGVYSTGPYKMWGMPKETSIQEMEMLKQGFYQAVIKGRGDKLKTNQDTILSGQIFAGSEALRLGLIDELGSFSDGVNKAAEMAKIANYQVENLRSLSGLKDPVVRQAVGFYKQTKDGEVTNLPRQGGTYLLYIPPMEVRQ